MRPTAPENTSGDLMSIPKPNPTPGYARVHQQWSALPPPFGTQPTHADLMGLTSWLLNTGIKEYENAFTSDTGLAVSAQKSDGLIGNAFARTDADYAKKVQLGDFYGANAAIFIQEVTRFASEFSKIPATASHADIVRSVDVLRRLLFDALFLFQIWSDNLGGGGRYYGIGKNPRHHVLSLTHAISHLLVSGNSQVSYLDNVSEAATALLRVAIEARIRRAFFLYEIENLETGEVVPLNMRNIFNTLHDWKNPAQITYAVPLIAVDRVYCWCNPYVHSAVRDFSWLPSFALRTLLPFFNGKTGGGNVNDGIQCSLETVMQIREDVLDRYWKKRQPKTLIGRLWKAANLARNARFALYPELVPHPQNFDVKII